MTCTRRSCAACALAIATLSSREPLSTTTTRATPVLASSRRRQASSVLWLKWLTTTAAISVTFGLDAVEFGAGVGQFAFEHRQALAGGDVAAHLVVVMCVHAR